MIKTLFLFLLLAVTFGSKAQATLNWAYSLEDDHFGNFFPPLTREDLWFDIGVNGGTSATEVNSEGELIYGAMTYAANPVYNVNTFSVITDTTYYFILKKFSPDGTELWSKSFANGQTDRSSVRGIAIDSEDNIILAGTHHDIIVLNDTILVHSNPGTMKSFIMKYTTEGELLFALSTDQMAVPGVFIREVKVDENDNIYFNTEHSIIKLDKEGNKLETVPVAGQVTVSGFNIDDQNNIYAIGHYDGETFLGLDSSYSFPLPLTNCQNGFVFKYNSVTGLKWVKLINPVQEGVLATVTLREVELSGGQVIISGVISAGAVYNFGNEEDTISIETTNQELFIQSIDQENSKHEWINRLTSNVSFMQSAVEQESGYLILSGTFSDSVKVMIDGEEVSFYAMNNDDLFITQIAPDGTYHSFTAFEGSALSEEVASISLLDSRKVITTFSVLNGTIDLDPSSGGELFVNCTSNIAFNSIIASYTLPEIPTVITGIELSETKLMICPNPASGFLTIQSDFSGEVKIISATGSEVHTDYKDKEVLKIELSGYIPDGVYTVKIISDQKTITAKLLIE